MKIIKLNFRNFDKEMILLLLLCYEIVLIHIPSGLFCIQFNREAIVKSIILLESCFNNILTDKTILLTSES